MSKKNRNGNTQTQTDEAAKAKAKAEAAERAKAARAKGRAEAKAAPPITRCRTLVNSFIKKLGRVGKDVSRFAANDDARVAMGKIAEATASIKCAVDELDKVPKDITPGEPRKAGLEFEVDGYVAVREKARKHYNDLLKPEQMNALKILAIKGKKLIVAVGNVQTFMPLMHVAPTSAPQATA